MVIATLLILLSQSGTDRKRCELVFVCLFFPFIFSVVRGFPHSSVGKESACNARDPGSIPG